MVNNFKDFVEKYAGRCRKITLCVHQNAPKTTFAQANLLNKFSHVGMREFDYEGQEEVWERCLAQGYEYHLVINSHYFKPAEHRWQEDRYENIAFAVVADTEERAIQEFEKYALTLKCELVKPVYNKG